MEAHKVRRLTNRRTLALKIALVGLSTVRVIVFVGAKSNGVDANVGEALKANKVVLLLMPGRLSRRSGGGVNRTPRP